MTPITIRAGDASAVVDPERGGMLTSITAHGVPLLAPARDGDLAFPVWGSFVMAPWVGHLSDGVLPFRGQVHHIPPNWGPHAVHGLVATTPWGIDASDTSSVRLSCRLGPPWPFGGVVRQSIALDEAGIALHAEVEAEGNPMPAALGWHPWFRRPDHGDAAIGVAADRLLQHEGELPSGRIEAIDDQTDLRSSPLLEDRRIDVVYVGAVSPAVLRYPGFELRVVFDPRIATLVVFTPPEAVCIEPWSSWPDANRLAAVGHDTGLVELEPGDCLSRWTRWEWTVDVH